MTTQSTVCNNTNLTAHSRVATTKRAYPWVVLSFCALFLFYKYILQVSPSIMANELMAAFHLHGLGLGNLAATYFYSYLVAQLFVGPLLDKYSPRLLTACAIGICALGAIVFAQAHTLLEACLARALIGIGAAFATVNYLKLTTLWFSSKNYAFVGALLATATMLGSVTGQAPLAYFVGQQGWQGALMDCGYLGLVIAVLYYLVVRNNPVDTTHTHSQKTNTINVKGYLHVLKLKHNWLLMFYSGLAFSPMAVFGGLWGNPFLQQAYHLTRTQSASMVSIAFVGLGVGAPVFGIISDRLGNRFLLMKWGLFISLFGLLFGLYLPQSSHADLIALSLFLFGFGTGAFMLGFTVGKELNNVIFAATVVGLINTGDAIFGAVTEPFVGKALDFFARPDVADIAHAFSLSDYHIAMGILPLYLLIAAGFLWRLAKRCDTIATPANKKIGLL